MKCEENGIFSKLWNDFWEPIIIWIFWLISMLITFVIAIIMIIARGFSENEQINDHEKTFNKFDFMAICLFFFTISFTLG